MEPWSQQIRYHRFIQSHILRWNLPQSWIGVLLSALLYRFPFSLDVANATYDELLQQKVTASPTAAVWDLFEPSSSPSFDQRFGNTLAAQENHGRNGSIISFIVFSSILLSGAIIFLLISCKRCRQQFVQEYESEWYLEKSLEAADICNNGSRNEGSDSTVKNDIVFSNMHYNTSIDTTEPDDDVNEFYQNDIESISSMNYQQDVLASFHVHHENDGPFVQDQVHDYDRDEYGGIESDDDYDTSDVCDLLLHDENFDDVWNQDDEFDDDFLNGGGGDASEEIHTGPIDIDSGEKVSPSCTESKLQRRQQQHGDKKRHRRDCKSSFTPINGVSTTTTVRKKRHKTVQKLRAEYFHKKYHDRIPRCKELQPILESSENDSISVSSISYRSKLRTVYASGLPEHCSDFVITETSLSPHSIDCCPGTIIV